MTEDREEIETEEGRPDHPVEWPKNDEVPADGVPLPDDERTPPVEEDQE